MSVSYKQAGVDTDAGDAFVDEIKKISKNNSIGLFGSVFDVKSLGMKDPLLVSGTDGVGTKLKLAFRANKHDTIGIDLVAMCVNDVLCHGARPLYFLDYIGTSKLNIEIGKEIIKGIVEGCKMAGCELSGGETAEMPGIYNGEEYDLAGFCVGAVERESYLPCTNDIQAGDILIGLPSSGVHSNGFSLVNYLLDRQIETSRELIDTLLTPTKIYVKEILDLLANKTRKIKGLAHITGGGLYENAIRILPKGLDLKINYSSIKAPEIFTWIQKTGNISDSEMRKAFNMGVGFTVLTSKECAEEILSCVDGGCIVGEVA